MKHGMTIKYLKCRADLNGEVDFGVNGAIGIVVTKWDHILFRYWIVFFHFVKYASYPYMRFFLRGHSHGNHRYGLIFMGGGGGGTINCDCILWLTVINFLTISIALLLLNF